MKQWTLGEYQDISHAREINLDFAAVFVFLRKMKLILFEKA